MVDQAASILPLTVDGVSVIKQGKTIIGPITAEIGMAGFTIVMGPNGAGKTTFLRLMHGMERPRGGSLRWRVPEVKARFKRAFVFQSPVMMRRSVLDNIAYPLIVRGIKSSMAREAATQWAEQISLGDMLNRSADVLSGGEKQKIALARALILKPDVLFLDEPTTNLDGRSTREIETLLRAAYQNGMRIIMATHDIGQARRLGTGVLFIYRGQLHETSSAEKFFTQADTQEARAFLNGDIVE